MPRDALFPATYYIWHGGRAGLGAALRLLTYSAPARFSVAPHNRPITLIRARQRADTSYLGSQTEAIAEGTALLRVFGAVFVQSFLTLIHTVHDSLTSK